ncbi:MAG: hypothetical protein K0S33_3787 [Bacteroidetes bacterium]|jgi:hypothetical protein|nr:hypothetical protein [Bacteroidota bacterium]
MKEPARKNKTSGSSRYDVSELQPLNPYSPEHEQLLDTYNEIREQFNLERKNETLNEVRNRRYKKQEGL